MAFDSLVKNILCTFVIGIFYFSHVLYLFLFFFFYSYSNITDETKLIEWNCDIHQIYTNKKRCKTTSLHQLHESIFWNKYKTSEFFYSKWPVKYVEKIIRFLPETLCMYYIWMFPKSSYDILHVKISRRKKKNRVWKFINCTWI